MFKSFVGLCLAAVSSAQYTLTAPTHPSEPVDYFNYITLPTAEELGSFPSKVTYA